MSLEPKSPEHRSLPAHLLPMSIERARKRKRDSGSLLRMVAFFKMAPAPQLALALPSTWGGKRKNAGRPVTPGRRNTLHRARPVHKARHPVHVTMRAAPEVG